MVRSGPGRQRRGLSPAKRHTSESAPALLVAAGKWSDVSACSAEDTLRLIKEEKKLTPTGPGCSQPVPAGADETRGT